MEPVESEVPQVQRHRGQGENKCTDQERTGCPVNPIEWNAEAQVVMTRKKGVGRTSAGNSRRSAERRPQINSGLPAKARERTLSAVRTGTFFFWPGFVYRQRAAT